MLIEFKVKNYRSIKDEQVLSMVKSATKELEITNTFITPEKKKKISLLRSATIYGANASGKSNLLKAFRSMQNIVLNSDSKIKRGVKLPVIPFLWSGLAILLNRLYSKNNLLSGSSLNRSKTS